MGQQQEQGIVFTGVVHSIAAAQLMKMNYVSGAHRATDNAETDLSSYIMITSATFPTQITLQIT